MQWVIAQQVEKVFPEAVNNTTDVVPDIYKKAPLNNGWIGLATDLKVGDRVRLITEKGHRDVHEVLEVKNGKFRTDFAEDVGQVFVYGFGAGGGIELPFGGVKRSGHGREKGFEGLVEFTTTKTLVIAHG